MASTTDWTLRGHRAVVEVQHYVIVIQVQTKALRGRATQDGSMEKWDCVVAAMTVPVISTLSDSYRMVEHWLAYFDDDQLTTLAMSTFATAWGEIADAPPPPAGAPAGPQGSLN